MTSRQAVRNDGSRRLGVVLAVSFGLTVMSFLGSRAVSEYQARGISGAALAISLHTLPANDLLANIRADLRHIEALIDKTYEKRQFSKGDLDRLSQSLDDSRRSVDKGWAEYHSLPLISSEHDVSIAAESDMRVVDTSLDEVSRLARDGDRERLLNRLDATRRAVEKADSAASTISGLNRRTAVEAAERIARYRSASRTWGVVLDAASALLAIVTLYFVTRVIRRFWTLVEERVVELEYFAGRVAHDVRSPLQSVSIALELAKLRPDIDPKTKSYLDRGSRTLQRVGQVVDGLLAFAVAGRPPSEAIACGLGVVLDGIVEDVRSAADEKGIVIDYESPDPKLRVACAPGVLASMASNLVNNAIKYMGDGPVKRVSIRTRPVASSIRFEVRDTGPGIPPSLRSRAFDPYVRGADSTIPGFGLGLATVRKLAEAHGGVAGVAPNHDVGSLFWFELPSSTATKRGSSATSSTGGTPLETLTDSEA